MPEQIVDLGPVGPDPIGREVRSLFDHVVGRALERLEGLTDHEYRWEPPSGDPASVTSIAWRLSHVSDSIARHPMNGFLQPGFVPTDRETPSRADAGLDYFRRSYDEWLGVLAAADPGRWLAPLGPLAGPFADSTALAIALHNADELIHHTAEIALLRDLYTVG